MRSSRIAILGGGNNGPTMAADLALQGARVNLFDFASHSDGFAEILRTGTIEKYGAAGTRGPTGTAHLDLVTTDMGAAIRDAELIFIACPAYAHMAFFEPLSRLLTDGQTVVVAPGNWGALRLSRILDTKGKSGIVVAETDVCTHICRHAEAFVGPGRVRVILERSRIRLAAANPRDTASLVERLRPFYPQLCAARSVIETTLRNDNVVLHGPLMLMNAGWLEHTSGDFMIYRDGVTPAVARMMDAVRLEREHVIGALGFDTVDPPAPGETLNRYSQAQWVKDPCETGPPTLTHRYLSEDVPFGLVPIQAIASLLGIPTPATDSIITMAGIVNATDYRRTFDLAEIALPNTVQGLRRWVDAVTGTGGQ